MDPAYSARSLLPVPYLLTIVIPFIFRERIGLSSPCIPVVVGIDIRFSFCYPIYYLFWPIWLLVMQVSHVYWPVQLLGFTHDILCLGDAYSGGPMDFPIVRAGQVSVV